MQQPCSWVQANSLLGGLIPFAYKAVLAGYWEPHPPWFPWLSSGCESWISLTSGLQGWLREVRHYQFFQPKLWLGFAHAIRSCRSGQTCMCWFGVMWGSCDQPGQLNRPKHHCFLRVGSLPARMLCSVTLGTGRQSLWHARLFLNHLCTSTTA